MKDKQSILASLISKIKVLTILVENKKTRDEANLRVTRIVAE